MNHRCGWGGGVGLLCFVGVVLGGCGVAQNRYDAVVADMESAKADLETHQIIREELERKNEKLRADTEKTAQDVKVMEAEIQRIKDKREGERALLEARDAEAAQISRSRIRTVRELRHAYRTLNSQHLALQRTVRRYQKELKEALGSASAPRSHNEASPAESVTEQRPATESPPVTTPLNGAARLLNLNTASMNDFVVLLGLLKPMAEKVIANRPYRVRGELLAKHVIPGETFDRIKNSVTAAPN